MLTLDLDATQLILWRTYQLHFLWFFQNISSFKDRISRRNAGEIHSQLIGGDLFWLKGFSFQFYGADSKWMSLETVRRK